MPHLFSPFTLRGLTLRNRIMMSPMCMYCAESDGLCTDWHLAHYQARAIGGVGLVVTEATAVEPRGRISARDLGLWDDAQIEPLARVVRLVQAEGAAIGVQLGHAGRKAWSDSKGQGPALPVAPSALAFDEGWVTPAALSVSEIEGIVRRWGEAAARAHQAGFDVIEIHAAHGYLNHQFLSPLSNARTDEFGGSLENRMRLLRKVVRAVRQEWPENKPLFVRLSTTDWAEGGLTPNDTVEIARALKAEGVDLIDCSSGGAVPSAPPGIGPGYQIPFAEQVRRQAGIATATVGLITTSELADEAIRNGRADLVALGRELLRHPTWPLEAAHRLGQEIQWPRQYVRARPS